LLVGAAGDFFSEFAYIMAHLLLHDLGIDLCCFDCGVAEDFRHDFNGHTVGERNGGECMPGQVKRDVLPNAAEICDLLEVCV